MRLARRKLSGAPCQRPGQPGDGGTYPSVRGSAGTLNAQIGRWNGLDWFVVADFSFYIHHPDKLADVDLHQVLDLPPDKHLRLLFPIAVVDELDSLKDAGKHQARWLATHTLGLLDSTLAGSTLGILRRADSSEEPAMWRGEVNVEIVLAQPGHVRLPITDDEIIDRAMAIQPLAAREVRLLRAIRGSTPAAGRPV
ncbi:PIN domain-containing protein [Streptomyces kronopolitis]|uniref:PIN domain-containing protein n=1 Tax=Streptomyces kronopolitis TaxID=1612435 RepID=UPI00341F8D36